MIRNMSKKRKDGKELLTELIMELLLTIHMLVNVTNTIMVILYIHLPQADIL